MIEYKNNTDKESRQFRTDALLKAVTRILRMTNMFYNVFYHFSPEDAKVFKDSLQDAFAHCDAVFRCDAEAQSNKRANIRIILLLW